MFRSAIGAIIFGAMILFTVFRMIGTEQNSGQVIEATQTLTAKVAGEEPTSGHSETVTREFAEPTPESWFDEEAAVDEFTTSDQPFEAAPQFEPEPLESGAAPPFDEAPVNDEIGGWGDGG